ncbi:septum formation family protein [Actinotalea sp. M2MS4P-6]|uniref:septum formation family protein n=1 Tax=Actinotalea sp. M2MS4P-6 TaxID=2983762 RepID=UPI0021E49744|nr:septum formation family protein [Actinotalea sp. M2MS4P-6]MCV2395229.1 septum formation family protein [Actinotalea sp. M2MS4P-6]
MRARVVGRSPVARAAAATLAVLSLAGCSLFNRGDTQVVSVLDAVPGDCLRAPTEITAEVTNVTVVPCTEPHEQEVYALVPYPDQAAAQTATQTAGTTETPYPGEAALKAFADGACLEAFAGYVGADYRDSSLFFTYLLPSARGWQAGGDRDVTCFITTTGEQRTSSVKGSGL